MPEPKKKRLPIAAASAPIHNMYAERTLGVIDALKKGVANADIGFLEAKARCQLNKTRVVPTDPPLFLELVDSLPPHKCPLE